jgi:hypothetical protein
MDIACRGTSFGYMIRSLNKRPKEEWEGASKAILEHHIDIHQYGGAWCSRKRMSLQQRQRSGRYYRNVMMDAKLYEVLKY